MKNWKWWILGIVLILFIPIIPYEKETRDGIVEVTNQSVGIYLYERYQTVQKKTNQRIMDADKQPTTNE